MIKALFAAVIFLVSLPVAAGDATVHYLGFNAFGADKAESGKIFDAYMEKLRPIMHRYGMTVEAYNVLHGGSDKLKADVITFGTAKDQQSFQAFFQDAEFQAIFPMLFGALEDHQVVFTATDFEPRKLPAGSHTLLSATWPKEEAGLKKIGALHHKLAPVYEKYGVAMQAHSSGVYSNRGLGAEISDTLPPALVELWAVRDAHGLFDDPDMKQTSEEMRGLADRTEDFWIAPRYQDAGARH